MNTELKVLIAEIISDAMCDYMHTMDESHSMYGMKLDRDTYADKILALPAAKKRVKCDCECHINLEYAKKWHTDCTPCQGTGYIETDVTLEEILGKLLEMVSVIKGLSEWEGHGILDWHKKLNEALKVKGGELV
jgi:hypothetical protein